MKKILFTLILVFTIFKVNACSCFPIKIVNAFSSLDYIGLIEYKTLTEIENTNGIFQSTYKLKELFKGNSDEEIQVKSMKGSSCGFIPEKNRTYLVLGYKTKKGKIITSICLTNVNPNKKILSILRHLKKEKIEKNISLNLRQIAKKEIDYTLFKKGVKGIFLYKVHLDSDLKIKKIIPQNENAKNNFNEKIRGELKNKIHYQKNEKEFKLKQGKFTSYIILNWEKNYDNKTIITTSKL